MPETADTQRLVDAKALLAATKRTVVNQARASGALDALDAIHVLDLEARVEKLESALRRRAAFERARELTTR